MPERIVEREIQREWGEGWAGGLGISSQGFEVPLEGILFFFSCDITRMKRCFAVSSHFEAEEKAFGGCGLNQISSQLKQQFYDLSGSRNSEYVYVAILPNNNS